jgi:hypothetical protein
MSGMILLAEQSAPGVPPADLMLAAAVYHKLDEHYPGHQWLANADHATGLVTVQLLYLDVERKHARWGFVLHIDKLSSDPTLRAAVRAGGELLERFRLSRERRRVDAETRQLALANGLDVSR